MMTFGWSVAAACVAVAGSMGSIWLSVGMDLKACPLCFYQRTFVMAAAGVLLMGLMTHLRRSPLPAVLALPAAVGGFGVAIFHVLLEAGGRLECPPGVFGLGSAPQQSLLVFTLLLVVLGATVFRGRDRDREFGLPVIASAVVLGGLFAVGAIISAPPMPDAPTEPYEGPPEVCRPPYRGD